MFSPFVRWAASWMRLLLCLTLAAAGGSRAFAEAVPPAKAALIRQILAQSIRSQYGRNVRGKQFEMVQTPSGKNQTSFRSYTRSAQGPGLSILTDTSGRRVAVIQDDDQWNRAYDPRARTLTVARAMRIPTDERSVQVRVRRILSSYRVTYVGLDIMAARVCHRLTMDPHDIHGRPIKVWIDAATGISLAREESDRRGNTFGLTAFTAVSYPRSISATETAFQPPKNTRVIRISRSPLFRDPGSLKKWGADPILPVSMPAGYEFEAAELVSLAGTLTTCLRYSDGLAMITIFQTQTAQAVQPSYESVAWKILPRGESVAVSGQTHVTSVVMGPRESDGVISVARALDRSREMEARAEIQRQFGISPAEITRLRDRGLGIDCIAALLEISRRTHRKTAELLALRRDGWSWQDIAARFKLNPGVLAQRLRPYECH